MCGPKMFCLWPKNVDGLAGSSWPCAKKRYRSGAVPFCVYCMYRLTNQVFIAPQTLITCPLT